MARIFITGSADGLGKLAARQLVSEGHQVVLHARNDERGRQALDQVPGAENVLTGDLYDQNQTRELANRVNSLGKFDAIIHNAGIYKGSGDEITRVNVLAPYILTCLIDRPERLIYVSSGMHKGGQPKIEELRNNFDAISYSDSKLQLVLLANAVARRWPSVFSNSIDPGWVPTKMGGAGAPDDLDKGYETQVWLATSKSPEALVTGKYFFHGQQQACHPLANQTDIQDGLVETLEELTGIEISSK